MSDLRADLHVHTLASDGADDVLAVIAAALAARLDLLAITDHERLDAARAARHLAADLGLPLHIVVGTEVTTRSGHLLALGIERPLRPFRPLAETIRAVRDAGGVAICAHPLAPGHSGVGSRLLARLVDGDPAARPDAIETHNPSPFGRRLDATVALAASLGYPATGSSDAHVAAHVGSVITRYPALDGADPWAALRAALAAATTQPDGETMTAGAVATVARAKARALLSGNRDRLAGLGASPRRGRSLGWPGSAERPPRLDRDAARLRAATLGLIAPLAVSADSGDAIAEAAS